MPATLRNPETRTRHSLDGDLVWLAERIRHAAGLLPIQRPITSFVTQNPLHAFEHLPFETGVVEGARLFGCHPYLFEDEYREKLQSGRIQTADLVAVLERDLGERAHEPVLSATRLSLRMAMLKSPVQLASTPELRWLVAESNALRTFRTDVEPAQRLALISGTRRWLMRDVRPQVANRAALSPSLLSALGVLLDDLASPDVEHWTDADWEECTLAVLWRACLFGTQAVRPVGVSVPPAVRHRDLLLDASGGDSDLLVNEVLIPFCAAFVDQGFANVTLPHRDAGFFEAFLALYGASTGPAAPWMQAVRPEIARLRAARSSALESIHESLRDLGVLEVETDAFLAATLAVLRGWASLIWQSETQPGLLVRDLPEGSLTGFLAVRLILERAALKQVARESLNDEGPLASLRQRHRHVQPRRNAGSLEARAFQVFQVAQLLGWIPEDLIHLGHEDWTRVLNEIDDFSGLNRRRVFHLAFERRYRHRALDAISVRASLPVHPRVAPRFQTISCMDDREESFRRWLEELCPSIETFAMPGFFGVAMRYRGVADAHFAALCPIVVTPKHAVVERVAESFEETHRRRTLHRKALGAASRQVQVGSRTTTGGVLLTTLFGPLASAPLVARVLAPRLAARIRKRAARFVAPPSATRLCLDHTHSRPEPAAGAPGYTTADAANVAESALRTIGLTSQFARLVLFLGHGSTSTNNPHKAAYDCGACGGSAGGPNGRAIAQMLNSPEVRSLLRQRGITIPDDTRFVGGWHNTCDESVELYDLDEVPESHADDLREIVRLLDEVGDRCAHERCRRFSSAPLDLTFGEARRHVEARSEDLAQTRPELGHATNALFIIGRRDRTRGLFCDRRAFFISYDPLQDSSDSATLARILRPAAPVSMGINLEYFFSRIDPQGWGCGTKLPHNVTSLVGVMDGAASDLRMGLPWQTVEIHEPMRLLVVIETTPDRMAALIADNPEFSRCFGNGWLQLALLDPDSPSLWTYEDGTFRDYHPETHDIDAVESSVDWYRGWRDHLGFALIRNAMRPIGAAAPPPRTGGHS